jgi:hypothetical protein
MKLGLIAAALLVTLTACGGGADADEATDAAVKLEGGVSSIAKAVEITEENDPNDLIGRPGSYQSATVFYDSRIECDDDAVVDVSCGAKVEVFDGNTAAEKRRDFLEVVVENMGGLVSEYDYLDGNVLLRVSGKLKPSEAEEYADAFN